MKNYCPVEPSEFKKSPFSLIGDEWMLVCAEKKNGEFNFLTASWGGFGVLWNRNVCFVFIRPSRYTHQFVEEADRITLSFFPRKYRSVLQICGKKSGRDVDKVKECDLHPVKRNGGISFEEAEMTIYARKMYAAPIEAKYFIDKSAVDDPENLHTMYICEIEKIEAED